MWSSGRTPALGAGARRFESCHGDNGLVAQLGRAAALQAEGCRFNSGRVHCDGLRRVEHVGCEPTPVGSSPIRRPNVDTSSARGRSRACTRFAVVASRIDRLGLAARSTHVALHLSGKGPGCNPGGYAGGGSIPSRHTEALEALPERSGSGLQSRAGRFNSVTLLKKHRRQTSPFPRWAGEAFDNARDLVDDRVVHGGPGISPFRRSASPTGGQEKSTTASANQELDSLSRSCKTPRS